MGDRDTTPLLTLRETPRRVGAGDRLEAAEIVADRDEKARGIA